MQDMGCGMSNTTVSMLDGEVFDLGYRPHNAPSPLLIGYDPYVDLPMDHLARFVEEVVEGSIGEPEDSPGPGQPAFDPRLCGKVLIYGYATGVRSSRQLERLCNESLPYLFLTRGDTPSYRTLCNMRVMRADLLEEVWVSLFTVADRCGMQRLGRIVEDSSKLKANAGRELVLRQEEYEAMKRALKEILTEAEATDAREDSEGYAGETRTGKGVDKLRMRDIVRKVRKDLSRQRRAGTVKIDEGSLDTEAVAKDGGSTDVSAVTPRMLERVRKSVEHIEGAEVEGRKHLCLTDPDARMMHGGVEKKVRECHSLEVAIDRDCGLLVAGGATQVGNDQARLTPLVEAAEQNEPYGVKAVDGDSGYYRSKDVVALISKGVDVCVPDSVTASELHRGLVLGSLSSRHRAVS